MRRRDPEAQSQADPGESWAARRVSPRAPRKRAAPAGTRRRGRADGEPPASGSPSTSRSRRAPRGTGPVPPGRPKWHCLPAPDSAGSEQTLRRVPCRWPLAAQKRARPPRSLYGELNATPASAPSALTPAPASYLPSRCGQPWLGSQRCPFRKAGTLEAARRRMDEGFRGVNVVSWALPLAHISAFARARALSILLSLPPFSAPFEDLFFTHQPLKLQLLRLGNKRKAQVRFSQGDSAAVTHTVWSPRNPTH